MFIYITVTMADTNNQEVASSNFFSLYIPEPFSIVATELPEGDYNKGFFVQKPKKLLTAIPFVHVDENMRNEFMVWLLFSSQISRDDLSLQIQI